MVESEGFKFSCPRCGQHLEAEFDMVGMTIDCPGCGQPLEVPSSDNEGQAGVVSDAEVAAKSTTNGRMPKIAVLKSRESFAERWKKRLNTIGIGIALLCLFVGVGEIARISNENGDVSVPVEVQKENPDGHRESSQPTPSANKKVLASVECLLDFLELPNDRRLRVLSDSLQVGPHDFKDVVSEYLVYVLKNPEDMISDKEKEEALQAKAGAAILFGLLGAASSGDSQRGVNAGLELGDMAYAELLGKAKRRLQDEIERKRNRLIEVAQTYGIDSNALEEALVSRER